MARKSENSVADKNRKPFAIAMLVVIAWFIITGIFGPLFGKLTSVQENNNASFLPKGAEATKASDLIPTTISFEEDVKLEIVIGKIKRADAKIAGITPAVLTFNGR